MVRAPYPHMYVYFLFFDMFYTHKHSTKLCSNSLLFNYTFQNYLCCTVSARNASDADISVIFGNSFFFVYRHSNLDGSFGMGLNLGL
jgi:hypothetical protein